MNTIKKILTVAVISTMVNFSSMIEAKNPSPEDYSDIAQQLYNISKEHPSFRHTEALVSHMGILTDGYFETYRVKLPKANDGYLTYKIVVVCSRGCENVSIEVFNSKNKMIAMNNDGFDYPVVQFMVNRSREDSIAVKINMESCSTGNCTYGFQVFEEKSR